MSMNLTEKMNAWTDDFYENAAGILLADNKPMINREKVAKILKVQPDQLTNAVWNGTLDIGYGHRADPDGKRHSEFPKAKVWRFLTGYMPKCMRQE